MRWDARNAARGGDKRTSPTPPDFKGVASLALLDWVLSTVPTAGNGGAEGTRTPDPLLAKQVLSQLSYGPTMESDNPQYTVGARLACLGCRTSRVSRCTAQRRRPGAAAPVSLP